MPTDHFRILHRARLSGKSLLTLTAFRDAVDSLRKASGAKGPFMIVVPSEEYAEEMRALLKATGYPENYTIEVLAGLTGNDCEISVIS